MPLDIIPTKVRTLSSLVSDLMDVGIILCKGSNKAGSVALVCVEEDFGWDVYGEREMIINNRFKMKTTPQEEAFERLSEEGMLSAMLENQGIIADVNQDWPKNLSDDELEIIYKDHLSAVCWLEFIINPESVGSSLPRSKYLGEWMRHYEWGLLPYASKLDFRFKFLHAWLVNLMSMTDVPSIKGRTTKKTVR